MARKLPKDIYTQAIVEAMKGLSFQERREFVRCGWNKTLMAGVLKDNLEYYLQNEPMKQKN